MDTEKVFMLHGQNTEFSFTQLSDDESSSAKRHVELMRHLQEIRQLYLMFQYCLDSIDRKYTLMSNGNLRIKGKNTSTEEDYEYLLVVSMRVLINFVQRCTAFGL